jgi:hypothetical protein
MHLRDWTWRQIGGLWIVGLLAIILITLGVRAYGAKALAEEHRLTVETAKAHGVSDADTAHSIFLVLSAEEAAQQRRPTRWLGAVSTLAGVLVLATLAVLAVSTAMWLWSHRHQLTVG